MAERDVTTVVVVASIVSPSTLMSPSTSTNLEMLLLCQEKHSNDFCGHSSWRIEPSTFSFKLPAIGVIGRRGMILWTPSRYSEARTHVPPLEAVHPPGSVLALYTCTS